MTTRFGIGYDAHKLITGESFYLAGIEILAEKGPKVIVMEMYLRMR